MGTGTARREMSASNLANMGKANRPLGPNLASQTGQKIYYLGETTVHSGPYGHFCIEWAI